MPERRELVIRNRFNLTSGWASLSRTVMELERTDTDDFVSRRPATTDVGNWGEWARGLKIDFRARRQHRRDAVTPAIEEARKIIDRSPYARVLGEVAMHMAEVTPRVLREHHLYHVQDYNRR